MAPKFPNPDPATDSVRDRLNQFIEVAGRAVYPPLAVAPSPTTAGQVWWDISDTVKIRNEGNAAWADLLTVLGGQPVGGYVQYDTAQTLTSGEKTQALSNIGAQPSGSYQPSGGYVRYDQAQTLTTGQQSQARTNIGSSQISDNVRYDVAQGLSAAQKGVARGNIDAAEAHPAAGAVGSFAFAAVPGPSAVQYGDVVAGSSLLPCGSIRRLIVAATGSSIIESGNGAARSGSWVCLGESISSQVSPSAFDAQFATLFRRVS